jgi:peptidyl-tRNA hydrolase
MKTTVVNSKGEVEAPVKTSTALVTISSRETALTVFGHKYKTEIDVEVKAIREMKIVDNNTLKLFRERITGANKFANLIEKRRKEAKAPYKEAGDNIDAAAKYLTDDLEKVIAEGKQKMLDFEVEAKKKADEENAKAELQAEKQRAAAGKIAAEKQKKIDLLSKVKQRAIEAMSTCETMNDLKTVYIEQVKDDLEANWKNDFADFEKEVKQTLVDLVNFKDSMKATIIKLEEARKVGDKKAALKAKQLAELVALEEEEKALKQKEESVAEIQAEQQEAEENAGAALMSAEADNKVDMGTMRISWDYELEDFAEVPDEWKTLNDSVVKQFIKDSKDEKILSDGCIINGVKFIMKKTPVLS